MRYISLFAGIGGFDFALNKLGHTCVYANEWDRFAGKTYERNFGYIPDTRSIVDVPTTDIPNHDLLVGGFPCQAFSLAGKRRGFEDTRGTLFFEIARVLRDKRPPYLLLENVKGLLSHDNGRTFQTIMWTLDELGYNLQWQVLNSKNFGVPQNRERVFIVGHFRGEPRPQVFPLTKSGGRDTSGVSDDTKTARTISARFNKGVGNTESRIIDVLVDPEKGERIESLETLVQRIPLKFLNRNQRTITGDYAYTVDCGNTGGILVGTLRTHEDGNGFREMKSAIAPTLTARARADGNGQPVIVTGTREYVAGKRQMNYKTSETVPTLLSTGYKAGDTAPKVYQDMNIRRLTPTECERLQGLPDNWTAGVSDSQRYKQLGNAVTVNVVYEVAKRIF